MVDLQLGVLFLQMENAVHIRQLYMVKLMIHWGILSLKQKLEIEIYIGFQISNDNNKKKVTLCKVTLM